VQNDLLDRVRKLLAKAENEGCSPAEAEALTAKAADLMAKYGIERAMLGALHPETDKPTSKVFRPDNPWADVKRHLLSGLASAMRCQCVQTRSGRAGADTTTLRVFGYQSDIDRAELLWTSLLVQMHRALTQQPVPGYGGDARAWRRSWMLGFSSAVVARVRAAEEAAAKSSSDSGEEAGGMSSALVLADRSLVIRSLVHSEFPRLRKARVTYSGSGYGDGYREGQKADIGTARLGGRQQALSR
jgi:hypothetical protein